MPVPIRKPEVSLGLALATGTIVWTIYNRGLPSHADIAASPSATAGDETIDRIRKQNAWMAASVVSGISLLAKDATVFIIGGAMVVALDWMVRINDWTNPLHGRVDINPFTVEAPTPTPQEPIENNASLYAVQ
jgi:hypothetical protein